jgi:serine/threonine protein kinase
MSDTAQGSRAGSHFGRYYLKRLLGRGGMGEVYEAEDIVKERVVALKVLSAAVCQDPVFRERLHREARTAGRLQEPHIVPVHDYGEIDGQLYLEMRLIEGKDLAALLRQSGPLSPPRAVAIVQQVASALDAAHAAGVIHRDIKPENMLITRDDFVYLVDFGIANAATDDKLTQAGTAVGTWKYAAPERFTKPGLTHSVDIYALTCVLYECLTGSPPYRADNSGIAIAAHLMEPIPHPSQLRPEIPGAFDEVIERGMAKDPMERYSSAGDLALAAHEALSTRDQNRAGDILEHSHESVVHDNEFEPTPTSRSPAPEPSPHPADPTSYPGPAGSELLPDFAPPPAVDRTWPSGGGPSHPATGRAAAGPPFAHGGGWPGRYPAYTPAVSPRRPASRKVKVRHVLGAVVVAAAVIGPVIWLRHPLHPTAAPSATPTRTSATTTSPTRASAPPLAESQSRLFSLLPQGYPPDTCKPATLPQDALAAVSCSQNADPGGPQSATYTLFPDAATLRVAFEKVVHSATIVVCPGRMQSPGPWHRIATPQETSGTLICAIQHGLPTVAWTNDSESLLSLTHADQPAPTLDDLYAWWMAHS